MASASVRGCGQHLMFSGCAGEYVRPEEVRHASRNAESACPFLYWRDGKKGHAESAFRDACRTSSDVRQCLSEGVWLVPQ